MAGTHILFLVGAALLVIPNSPSAAFGPQPRKAVRTTGPIEATKPAKSRAPRHIETLRRSRLPEAGARVSRGLVARPIRRLVPVEGARKPVRLEALAKPVRVSFTPCGADLPPQSPQEALAKPGMDGAVLNQHHRWPSGATLKIGFVDGHRAAREMVAHVAKMWTDYANVHLEFSLDAPPPNADILIRFDADACSSKIGTSSRYAAENGEPSMRLCHMDQKIAPGTDPAMAPESVRRTVLHEFGHALGLHHEHQNPRVQIQWNKPAVYEYYAVHHGWDRERVDHNLFEQLASHSVDASQYDPDSIMHYAFPAQFTTNGVAYGGKKELSSVDKEEIAKAYPRDVDANVARRYERKIAVRNETGTSLDVQVVYESRKTGEPTWLPTSDLSAAPTMKLAAGAERSIEGQGRWAKLVARSADGRSTWSDWAEEPLRIAPKGGYLDVVPQTYVIVIDGPPDQPAEQTREELYGAASRLQTAGDQEGARALFGDFVAKFSSDPLVPWARFNIVVGWYEEKRWEEALQASYDLIVDHPHAEAAIYAWYYGGVTALQLSWCEGARSYLGYVKDESSGAPEDWRASAEEYLTAMERDPDRWCS